MIYIYITFQSPAKTSSSNPARQDGIRRRRLWRRAATTTTDDDDDDGDGATGYEVDDNGDDDDDDDGDDDDDYGDAIGDSQLCCLRFNGIVEEDTTMCLLDEGDHRSP